MDDTSKMKATMKDVTDETIDFDDLESQLEGELEEKLSELHFLESEREQIGNPDALGSTIKNVVWEQFLNQIAVVAGEDFIEANSGLTLDLRTKAHVQSVEGFEQQEYAAHNTYVDYVARGEEYRSNFYTDHNNRPPAKQKQEQRYNDKTKVWETYDPVDGKWKKALKPDYRKPYEEDRNKDKKNKFGSKTVNKDHQVADATIARDAEAGAYMTKDEKVVAANSDDNLYDLDSAANQSKSDHDGEKWIKHKRTGKNGKGQTNGEYFGIDEDEYIEQDKKAKEAYEGKKREKREEEIALGKKSQREEAFKIGGKALRAVVMQLLAELVKEIIGKLVKWLKNKKKNLDSLIESIKAAIKSFVSKLKKHMVNAVNTLITTIATAIIDPVVGTIKKVWMMLKQGWKSLKDAVAFLKNPENQNMPMSLKVLEIGKIVMVGVSGVGALVLGEIIEKGLMTVPALAVEIPLIGSLANIIGIFMGSVVAGIIGAIVINLLDNATAKKRRELSIEDQIDKGNEILKTQRELREVTIVKTDVKKKQTVDTIKARHIEAGEIVREAVSEIFDSEAKDNKLDFDEIDSALDDLLGS